MKDNKQKFLDALKENKGKTDEIALGESLGFSKEETNRILEMLMSEEKIEYRTAKGASNYKVKE